MDYVRTDIRNLAELVRYALAARDDAGYQFLSDASDSAGTRVSLSDLAQRANAHCGWLQHQRVQPGDRVLILASALEAALPCVLGASLCGAVPVSLLPPLTAAELATYAQRVTGAVRASGARAVVAPSKLLKLLPELGLHCIPLEASRDGGQPGEPVPREPWDDALLVLGGDAGAELTPRVFRHADVLASLEAACASLRLTQADVVVSWLPLSHDAGLLAALLPLYLRCSAAMLSTTQFLRRPGSWLRAISRVRGSVSWAPGQAYALCAQRVSDSELAGLDLSSWRRAVSLDELPPPAAADRFEQRFAQAGLNPSALSRSELFSPLQRDLEAPLSLGQQALWFLAQLAPDSVAYNESLCLRIRSEYDVRALRAALETVLVRHPSLRTVFGSRGGVPYRRVLEHAPDALRVIDAAAWDEAELAARLVREAERSFDLEHGPVLVMRLYTRGPADALLLFAAHHSVVDGFSQVRIVAELAELYPRALRGASLTALPLPAQTYDDFVRWQAQLLAGPEGARLRSFWQRELDGAPVALALPVDRPRPAVQSYRGATVPVELPDALVDALRALGKRHDATLYAVLLAVFQGLLHRLSGQRDILVATPSLGRSGMAFADVVGYFVNTLPIRARLDAGASFEALLATTRASTLQALDHQDLPFASIVELARVPRDASRSPLCQVLFQLHTYRPSDDVLDVLQGWAAGRSAQLGGMTVEAYELERRIAQFELALDLTDFGAGVSGRLEYNTDLLDQATVRRWVEQFLALAQAIVHAPSAALESHVIEVSSLLPPEQRELVLQRWNATAVDYPAGRVHYAVAAQAARDPERIAVSAGEHTLSYGELERRASCVAQRLRAAGAGRDVLVGVCMDRSIELVTVLLGVMKAGAAYVPLDPTYPAPRLRFMIDDAQPAVIIADEAHLSLVQPSSAPVWSSQRALASETTLGSADLPDDVAAEDLVYVIYTSGSTGTPKGVANTHGGLWNRLMWMQEHLQLGGVDRVLHKTPYSFDVSVWELFWPLMTGARLVIAAPNGHTDSRYLADEIARRGVTTVHFVPSMLEAFLLEPELERCACLSRVVCSGEALPYAVMTHCLERLPGASLHNLYGPTEASIDVTAWRCIPNARGIVPIGRPIANTEIYMLDAQREPVAIGTVGELYIGGVGLARGYHARPELTAERFVRNPFSSLPDARLYRTGDLARFDADGCIEYVGRNDDQIKLRGFRIELGEIEAALREHPELQAAAVIADGTALEAFVVCARESFDVSALRGWLRAKLPEHMVPSRIVPIERLPLTHSGKTDRRALLSLASQPRARACVAPRTPLERDLAEIFQDVLRIADVSVHDNYFELGGDSIRSLQVRALARARGLSLEVAWLLTHQTIAELATRIGGEAQQSQDESPAPLALLRPSERATLEGFDDAYPATRLQLGMLYHSELTRDSWAYHDVMSLRIELGMPWQEAAMAAALDAVVARHSVLRSSFDAGTYAQPIQRIHRSIERPLTIRDLSGLEASAARELIRSYIEADKRRGYDLASAPLFRLMIHVLAPHTVQFTLGFHHAILDGWSTATLLRELFSEYLRRSGVEGMPLFEAPPHTFSAFVALERRALDSDASRAYFASALEEMQLTRLPRWPEPLRSATPGAARLVLPLDESLTGPLRELSGRQRAPLKALLMAAHVRALAVFSGALDVVTGCVVHGRPELEAAERILGLFLNTLPARFKLTNGTWAELIAQAVRTEQELHPHRHFPLHDIQRLLDRKALFETAFNFVHFHQYQELLAGGSLRVLDYESHENTAFAVMVNFVLHPGTGRLELHLQYDTQRIAPAQARQLARGHVLALEHMLRDPEAKVGPACLIDPEERAVLDRWSRGELANEAAPLHVLFERQVARTPDWPALQLDGVSLSYRELDGWANHVAHELLAAGVRRGEAIAICAEPCLQRAAAVLGVLKAGCACLPLDAEYPPERLSYMLERAGARHALATRQHAAAGFLRDQQVQIVEHPTAAAAPRVSVGVRDPAYVIFTSGSTGRPKGILMPHEPLAKLVSWHVSLGELEAGATTAQHSLFGFDVSLQEMFSTWASGGRLVMVPEPARKDARQLAKLLAQEHVARLFVPVVALHQLAEVAEQLQLSLPHLREVDSAGEQLEITAAVRAFFERHPRCRLHNQYGPSETHVATTYRLPVDPATWPVTPGVGRPLPGIRAYVLDDARQPAPIGVPGELFLAGPSVGLGYCNEEALTAERFAADPHGDRMYQTGDLLRWLPDGQLEYCGRRDSQLKIRGYRVELGEIESALVAVSDGRVQRAVVLAVAGRSKAQRHELVAYVVSSSGAVLEAAQLRAALAKRVPSYMLPSALHVLDALPTAPSGKIDRQALAALLPRTAAHAPAKVAPRTPLETELCGLWQQVLDVRGSELGVTDDFFASGGDSLGAVRLMARIQRRYGVELPISALIEAPTVRELAHVLSAAGPATRAPALVHLGGSGTRPPVFCVHPIGGHVLCYIQLARRLGQDQPCFGIQARGLTGTDQPQTSVVEMASAYAAEILGVQPHGSVQLAGWSFGGAVALEIARQLRHAGREVAPVVILDGIAKATSVLHMSEDDLFEFVAMELFGVSIEDADIEAVLRRDAALDQNARLERLSALVRARRVLPEGSDLNQLEHVIAVIRSNIQAIYDHEPRVYDGPVVLLRCTDPMPARLQRLHELAGTTYRDPSNGWAEYCPQLEIIPVAGDHVSIVFEPHVATVAQVLRRIVADGAALSAAE